MVKRIMESVKQCPICGGAGEFHNENNDNGVLIRMDKCTECGVEYQNPRLSRADLDAFYQDGTYFRAYSRGNSQDRVNRIITMLRLMDIKPKRALDYGCANGYLLRNLQVWFGSRILGLDIYTDKPLVKEIVYSKDEVDGEFDLITCLHVLEHIYDPQAELEWMLTKLEPGGTLLIEVPSTDKILLPHVFKYSEKALRLMVERTGNECMFLDHGPMYQVFVGDGYSRFIVERVVEEPPSFSRGGLYGYDDR